MVRIQQLSVVDPFLVQAFYLGWLNYHALEFVVRVDTRHLFSRLRHFRVHLSDKVSIWLSAGQVQSVHVLAAGQSRLADVLGHLHAWLSVDFDELVHAAERGLRLAGNQMGSDAVGVDAGSFLVQVYKDLLGNVVRCTHLAVGELVIVGMLVWARSELSVRALQSLVELVEDSTDLTRQIRQISGVETNTDWLHTVVDQRARDDDEVGDAGE